MPYVYPLLLLCLMSWPSCAELPQPSLTDVVLFANFPLSSLSLDAYTANNRACAEDYVAVAKSFFSEDKNADSEDERISLRHWRLERHITAILGMESRGDAEKFAAGVPLGLEWEGMSEGPMIEADYAQQWLERYPSSPIKPFLHLFAAHRFRAAYETASREHAKGLIPIVAAKYRLHLQEAQSTGNDKIVCIAGDMDALPYVYLSGFGRP